MSDQDNQTRPMSDQDIEQHSDAIESYLKGLLADYQSVLNGVASMAAALEACSDEELDQIPRAALEGILQACLATKMAHRSSVVRSAAFRDYAAAHGLETTEHRLETTAATSSRGASKPKFRIEDVD